MQIKTSVIYLRHHLPVLNVNTQNIKGVIREVDYYKVSIYDNITMEINPKNMHCYLIYHVLQCTYYSLFPSTTRCHILELKCIIYFSLG